jgi:hypothetical protein
MMARGRSADTRSVSRVTGKVETLWLFVLKSRLTRPNGALSRDPLVLKSGFTRPNDALSRDPLVLKSGFTRPNGALSRDPL